MRAMGHADLSSAHLTISHAADYIWHGWAAVTPGKQFWEDVRDDFEELDVASDVTDVCLTKHDCCAVPSDDESFQVNYVDLHESKEVWNAALDEAEILTQARTTSKAVKKTLAFTADAEAPALFQLVREACNWEISGIQLAAVPKACRFRYNPRFSHRGHAFASTTVRSKLSPRPTQTRLRASRSASREASAWASSSTEEPRKPRATTISVFLGTELQAPPPQLLGPVSVFLPRLVTCLMFTIPCRDLLPVLDRQWHQVSPADLLFPELTNVDANVK
jgi:hypothetical protein